MVNEPAPPELHPFRWLRQGSKHKAANPKGRHKATKNKGWNKATRHKGLKSKWHVQCGCGIKRAETEKVDTFFKNPRFKAFYMLAANAP